MTERIARERFPVPVDGDGVARDWAARGYSCGLFTDPPGQVWADFVHASNELITVVEGCLEVTVGGEYLVANPGDEVFIPKSVVHTVRNLAPTATRWLYGYD